MLQGEPALGEDDDLFEDVEETSLMRVAEADPDNELECAGGGIEASIAKKPRNEQPPALSKSAYASPVKPTFNSASLAPQSGCVASPRPAASPPQTEQKSRGVRRGSG